jgi:hypothetical protein
MPQLGESSTSKSGRPIVYTAGGWAYADGRANKGTSAGDTAYDRKLGTAAAEETIAVRERAANAPSQIANAKQLLAELPNRRTGPGAEIGMTLGALGVLGSGGQQNAAFQRRLNAFASKGVLADAATIKPISNSDIAFLQTLQAGANQSPEANRQFLIASDWADQLAVANQTARDRWTQQFGSPNARDRQGRDFATFWMREYPRLFPRPNFGKVPKGKGYDFRQQRQSGQGQPANLPAQTVQSGGKYKWNPATGDIE